MLRSFIPALFLSVSGSSVAAAAEPFVPASGIDGAGLALEGHDHGRAWLDTTAFFDSDGGALSPVVGGGVLAARNLEIELGVPFALTTGDNSDTDIGNPYAGLNFLYTGEDLRSRAGLRLAAPLADADGFLSTPLFAAGLTSGLDTIYLHALDAFGVVPNGRLEYDAADELVLTVDAQLPILVPVRDGNDTDVLLTVAPGVAVRPTDAMVVGLRAPVSAVLTGGDGDNVQAALQPFVRGNLGPGFLSARFTYNVDEPLGPSFDENRVWNVGLGAGVAF